MATVNAEKQKQARRKKTQALRNNEYYGMQSTYDSLFSQSTSGAVFENLMEFILHRENILLAYRNIKKNSGSNTPGTDGMTIKQLAKLSPDELVDKTRRILKNYTPRPVRRKEIPKPNGKLRPLGIPCIWDRLIQQSILQVLEPICEAKFSDNSFGFRPNRSADHAITRAYGLMQLQKLNFVVEVDVKSFFDEVNHAKLIRQIWALGIRDKHLIYIIRRMLTAPIHMEDKSVVVPTKGTPQGGILSPLLANIVLNELDKWVESQWKEHPVCKKYKARLDKNGNPVLSHGYRAMRETGLKEIHIIRYADDFRIFCRTRTDAAKTMVAVTQWLQERLKLQVSPDKTRIVNLKRQYSEFLGIKLKVIKRADKYVVKSHVSDKPLVRIKAQARRLIKDISHPADNKARIEAIFRYNAFVMGEHNYFQKATCVSEDFSPIAFQMDKVLKNCLGTKVAKVSQKVSPKNAVLQRYGRSKQVRYIMDQPIAPIGYVRHKTPMGKKRSIQKYTPEGRTEIHDTLRINVGLLLELMRQSSYERSLEFMDNRISLFCAQYGRCAVTLEEFSTPGEIHCHHRKPRKSGGGDEYKNLILVSEDVHRLIHATDEATIQKYLAALKLPKSRLTLLNKLRHEVGNEKIAV